MMPSELSEVTAVGLIPKEAPAQVRKSDKSLIVGLPKEASSQEKDMPDPGSDWTAFE
jgi:alanine dehydrogenase